jgi:hypothetical protein
MALSLPPPAREKLKDFLICFSLGNLCFLRRWYDLEHLKERSMEYYRSGPADLTLLYATLIGSLLLTAVFWAALLWVQKHQTPGKIRVAQAGFLLLLIYPLESVRRYWNTEGERYDLSTNIALLAIEATLFVGMLMAVRGKPRMVTAAKRVTLFLVLLLPALLMDFGLARASAPSQSEFKPLPTLPMLAGNPPRRVLWILFDEFDEKLAFEVRRPAVNLPELDRLRGESFVATAANQTATWTMMALPSLIDGRMYSRVDLLNMNTMRVFPEDGGKPALWHDQPNVFRRAHDLGINTALVGWHHPYCRVIGDSLSQCIDVPNGHPTAALLREMSVADEGIAKAVVFLFELQLSNLLDMVRGGETNLASRDAFLQRRQQKQYFEILQDSMDAAADPRFGLVMEHFPIPHPYGIYNSKRADFTLSPDLSYGDNLALVDRTVGELRRCLEEKGLWDSTTILISSDHGLRPDVWRGHQGWTKELEELTAAGQSPIVPFIVKFAGKKEPVTYDHPFSAVYTGDFLLNVLSGKITGGPDAAAWLDKHPLK